MQSKSQNIFITFSSQETKKLGKQIAYRILRGKIRKGGALTILLSGELGSGKTTFVQGFISGLGVNRRVISPSFIIERKFHLKSKRFSSVYHIDLYRLNQKDNLEGLMLNSILDDSRNIVIIEWGEKIKKLLLSSGLIIKFEILSLNSRKIILSKPLAEISSL